MKYVQYVLRTVILDSDLVKCTRLELVMVRGSLTVSESIQRFGGEYEL